MVTTNKTPAGHSKTDWFLLAILASICLLLLGGVVSLVFSRQAPPELPDGPPGRTVQKFLNALEQRNYELAYTLLSNNMDRKPSLNDFTRYNTNQASYYNQAQILTRLNSEKITGDKATVEISYTYFYNSGSPFGGSGESTSFENFSLQREEGNWRISSLPPRFLPYYAIENPYK